MSKTQVLVSTDIVGLEADPDKLVSVYSEVLPLLEKIGQTPLKLENIAWKHSYPKFLKETDRLNFKIMGFHGRLGDNNRPGATIREKLFNTANNLNFPSDKELFELGKLPFPGYVLVHQPETETEDFQELITHQDQFPNCLLVENCTYYGSLQRTVNSVANLRKAHLNVGLMIDLGHTLFESNNYTKESRKYIKKAPFKKIWLETLGLVKKAISTTEIASLHIPIGSVSDSIPLILMDDYLWQELAKMIKSLPQIKYLTIENAHRCSFLTLKAEDELRLKERNKQIFQTLIKNKVIN